MVKPEYGKWIPEFEGRYSITDCGTVFSHNGTPYPIKVRKGMVNLALQDGENTYRSVPKLLKQLYQDNDLTDGEQWISGYEGEYSYSLSSGALRVFSYKRGKTELKQTLINGRLAVSLYSKGLKETFYLDNLE